MKFTEKDLERLAKLIKEFKAGIIDKKLDEHIDKCVLKIKEEAKRRHWWKW